MKRIVFWRLSFAVGCALCLASQAASQSQRQVQESEKCAPIPSCYRGLPVAPYELAAPSGNEISLSGPAAYCYCSIKIPNGLKIRTNGHRLLISAEDRLIVGKDVYIVAFDKPAASAPAKPPKLRQSDPVGGAGGSHGSNGEKGDDGDAGAPGLSAKPITIMIGDRMLGSLTINNSGQAGGNGGRGGDGGAGANGQQGRRARNDGLNVGCAEGVGNGGRGGNGGDGGQGGVGGPGGNGGQIRIVVPGEASRSQFKVWARGGDGGSDGDHGTPGAAGKGASHGKTTDKCHAIPSRNGADGVPGKTAVELGFRALSAGTKGASGPIKFEFVEPGAEGHGVRP